MPRKPTTKRKAPGKPKTKAKTSPRSKVLAGLAPDTAIKGFISGAEMVRREAWAQAFVACGDVIEACRQCGIEGNARKLRAHGDKLMADPTMRERISRIARDLLAKHSVTTDTVWGMLFRAAKSSVRDLFDDDWTLKGLGQIDPDARDSIDSVEITERFVPNGDGEPTREVKTKIKMPSRLATAEAMAKIFRMGALAEDSDKGAADKLAQAFLDVMGARDAHVSAAEAQAEHDDTGA